MDNSLYCGISISVLGVRNRYRSQQRGRIPVILYGPDYWNEVLNFKALARHGVIDTEDLELFHFADSPAAALQILQARLEPETQRTTPAFAHSQTRA
jgi:predicted Rossmann-fold nucleotide-binding protein